MNLSCTQSARRHTLRTHPYELLIGIEMFMCTVSLETYFRNREPSGETRKVNLSYLILISLRIYCLYVLRLGILRSEYKSISY